MSFLNNNNNNNNNILKRFNEFNYNNSNNNNKINIGEIYNGNLYITKQDIQKYLFYSFFPIAISTTIFAPFERIKTILQTIDLISIRKSEKVYRPKELAISKYKKI
jgi:hypothetical protein